MEGDFEPEARSVRRARDLVRATLGPRHEHLGTAVLLTSELATNVVVHAQSPFHVLVDDGPSVRVMVTDSSPEHLVMREPTGLHPAGRGLRIIEALAARWGVEYFPGGKRVWFEIE